MTPTFPSKVPLERADPFSAERPRAWAVLPRSNLLLRRSSRQKISHPVQDAPPFFRPWQMDQLVLEHRRPATTRAMHDGPRDHVLLSTIRNSREPWLRMSTSKKLPNRRLLTLVDAHVGRAFDQV